MRSLLTPRSTAVSPLVSFSRRHIDLQRVASCLCLA